VKKHKDSAKLSVLCKCHAVARHTRTQFHLSPN